MDLIFEQFMKTGSISTDTRNITPGSIFFALKGERFNGNEFAMKALEQGAMMSVVDEEVHSADDRIIRVADVLQALQNLSGMYRDTFHIPFLAITGSNGKTTTKELIRDVVSRIFRVSATKGNLNNHIGVPLTLLSIPKDCEFAIIEMGANHRHEISGYCQYAKPDFGLITNIGKAHLEGFGGEEGVYLGKKELYDYINQRGGKVFANVELDKLDRASQGMDRIPYGYQSGGIEIECISESPTVTYRSHFQGKSQDYQTHLAGAYNLYNIASAIIVGRYFGIAEDEIHQAICAYQPDNNRSQLRETGRNVLIMDAYNANPSSLEFALIALSKQANPKKYFVIGDMLELGPSGPVEHQHILNVAKELGLNGITVGPIFKGINPDYPAFDKNTDALEYLQSKELSDHIILIKGSRGIRLEEVVSAL